MIVRRCLLQRVAFSLVWLGCVLLFLPVASLWSAESRLMSVDFNRDIKPILSNHCFACHGPDRENQENGLRLDLPDEATVEAIVPGSAAKSPLLERILSKDPDVQMPPAGTNKPRLSAEEIQLVRLWIDSGAKYDVHWAYTLPVRPKLPTVDNEAWSGNPIDRFIAAEHQQRGYTAAPEAESRTLIRRLSFDLTGLPPTAGQIKEFEKDHSPAAYEKLVDRLLGSDQYGERMAAYWLDLVRYADTNGIHGDNHRDVSSYRDYVIDAFNDNKPYDRFTVEQLAGDLFPEATIEQKIASGYNRLNMTTREGGAQAKEYIAKYAADRVRNVSTLWLASTMGCTECHDHKYDPFLTKDFYSLAAFFADIEETPVGVQKPGLRVPSDQQSAELKRLDQALAGAKKDLSRPLPGLTDSLAGWEEKIKSQKVRWTTLQPSEAKSKSGATLKILADHSILASEKNPDSDTYTITFASKIPDVTAIRLEVLPDESLPAKGPGRAANGNFVLNELKLSVGQQKIEWSNITATHEQKNWAIGGTTDGKPQTGWAILPQLGRANHAVYEAKANIDAGGDKKFVLSLVHNYGSSHTLGKFRVSVTDSVRPIRAGSSDGIPPPIAEILAIAPIKRTSQQQQALEAHYRTIAPQLDSARKKLADLQSQRDKLYQSLPTTLISKSIKPRVMRVLPRGNWLDDSGEIVSPAVPTFLATLKTEGRASRMDLARWLVSKDNPLVARVMVNRLWKLMFGRGISKSLGDFGSQGDPPTHPQLLDWLAVEFRESGWDIKHLLKQMAMTKVYRQSSYADAELIRRDPANRRLARQGRFRLDAEMIRDNALAVSGLLSKKSGGRSVKPYQPSGYWAHLNFPKRVYKNDKGEDLYRRGLYTYWARTFLHPSLLAFDAPSREECTVERAQSNTPLQALVLLNDPTYVEAARNFAAKALRQTGLSTSQRIDYMFDQALGRKPRPEETKILSQLYQKHRQEALTKILAVGESKTPDDLDPIELSAWTSVCRVIFNLHETITRY